VQAQCDVALQFRDWPLARISSQKLADSSHIAAGNRIHDVKDRNMNDCHRPTRSRRSQLLAKNSVLADGHWRVVESGGIERYLVPMKNPVGGICALPQRRSGRSRRYQRRPVALAPHLVEIVEANL